MATGEAKLCAEETTSTVAASSVTDVSVCGQRANIWSISKVSELKHRRARDDATKGIRRWSGGAASHIAPSLARKRRWRRIVHTLAQAQLALPSIFHRLRGRDQGVRLPDGATSWRRGEAAPAGSTPKKANRYLPSLSSSTRAFLDKQYHQKQPTATTRSTNEANRRVNTQQIGPGEYAQHQKLADYG